MLTIEQRTRLGVAEQIFEGSNSEVYRMRGRPGRGPAILKVLKADGPQMRERVRFHQESVIAERVLSPYVARVYRPVSDPVALVVEDIGGLSLAQYLVEAPPDLAEGLRIAIAIARGLRSIHAAHVAHKDISPSNVIWNRETEELRIIDFGIASLLDSDLVQPEAPRDLEGNLPYMSPEQTGRMNRTIDYRTDLYSFGVTLFELFTGRLPFQSADPLEVVYCHLARPPPHPRSITPALPVALGEILLRLLAKSAEDRYQSAEGVEADLAEVLRRLSAPGEDTPFELGKEDRAIRFLIPSKLYGREEAAARLIASFERVRAGGMVLTLVSGYSGVGKTSLVHELYRPLAAARGRYTSGKFDQYQRGVPYSAIAATFNALCGQIVAEGPELRQAWSERLLARLGPGGAVLCEVLPRLAEVIGPQPPAPRVDLEAARNRFNEAFCNFLEAAARPEEPLVVFLDDLQWADFASLQLLQQVLLTRQPAGLHLVGAFRDNEVETSHPLALMLEVVSRAGRPIETIHLDNLRPADLADLVADAVSRAPAEVSPLADAIYAKTKGNAFFTIAFLRGLADERLLSYGHRRWTWDLEGIAARDITDNVVDFMARRIQLFGADTQAALTMAACVGNAFDLTTLGVLLQPKSGLPEVLEDLSPALAAGVIVATTPEYKKVGIVEVDGALVRFRFQHDRVQQAAYSLIPQAARPEVHHRIGRLLHAHALRHGTLASRLFEVVGHLNQGVVVDARARLELARLNHTAGLRAFDASAYLVAADLFEKARAMLPDNAFDTEYVLALAVHLDLARSFSINGWFDRSGRLYPLLLTQAVTPLDQARVRIVQMDDVHLQGDYDRAIEVQRAGLGCLGFGFPDDLEAAITAELAESQSRQRERTLQELFAAPELRSDATRAALRLLIGMWMSAYLLSRDPVVQWCSIRMSNLTLQFGNSEYAAFAYVQYAYLCVLRLNDPKAGFDYGTLATRLADRYENPNLRGKVYFNFAIFVNHWTEHIRTSTDLFRKAYLASVEGGDWTYAVYGAANIVSNLLIEGRPCLEVEQEANKYLAFLQTKAPVGLKSFFLGGAYCALLDLQGRTARRGSFDCAYLDEAEHLRTLGQLPIVEAWFYSAKLRSLFLYRRLDEALAVAEKADIVRVGVPCQIKIPEAYFYSCLILASTHQDLQGLRDNPDHYARFTRYAQHLTDGARHAPDNLAHKHLLVEAEVGRLEHLALGPALERYDAAIRSAEAAGYPNNAAVGRELKGRFWLSRGPRAYGIAELSLARDLYVRWGATGKVAHLTAEFPELEGSGGVAPTAAPTAAPTQRAGSRTPSWASLDIASLHKAALAISSKLDWDTLLAATLPIVMESLGADRGLLLVQEDGAWTVQAAEGDLLSRDYPRSAIALVAQTHAILFLDAEALPAALAADRYFHGWQRGSAVCAPIVYHDDTLAVLYLENTLASGAFPRTREQTLSILVSQLAVSLKNARLFGQIEASLAARVRELNRSNAELEQFAYVACHDLQAPLRHVALHLKLVEEALGDTLTGRTKTSFGHVLRAAARMQALVQDLLSLSRVGRAERKLKPVNVPLLVDELKTLLEDVIGARMASVTYAGVETILADPVLIRQVFTNLLHNALKFVPKDRAPVVAIRGMSTPSGWRIEVEDNGVGFPEHGRERAFQLFQRLHSDPAFEGTGLGLAICKKVVELHGGTIALADAEGGGARVEFTLPGEGIRRSE